MAGVSELSFMTFDHVETSWEYVRGIKNYQEILGAKIFTRFFQLCPDAKSLYGFGESDSMHTNPKFVYHSKRFVKMFDTVIDMLGPDLETTTAVLHDLGKLHTKKYGVKTDYFEPMGMAVMESVKEVLMENTTHPFTKETEDCWKEVYKRISTDMKSEMKDE